MIGFKEAQGKLKVWWKQLSGEFITLRDQMNLSRKIIRRSRSVVFGSRKNFKVIIHRKIARAGEVVWGVVCPGEGGGGPQKDSKPLSPKPPCLTRGV